MPSLDNFILSGLSYFTEGCSSSYNTQLIRETTAIFRIPTDKWAHNYLGRNQYLFNETLEEFY